MINLLSPEDKKQLRAARTNSLLVRYYFLAALVIAFSGLIFYTAFYITDSSAKVSKLEFAKSEENIKGYETVRQEAKSFENNLKIARQILSVEVIYSRMITDIARLMPAGTVLSELSLNPETISNKMDFSFKAKQNQGIQLKTAFENSKSFSDVSISRITKLDSSDSLYAYEIIIKAKFHPDSTIPKDN